MPVRQVLRGICPLRFRLIRVCVRHGRMIPPLCLLFRLRGDPGHHGRPVIRNRGQQHAHKKQRAQANGEFRGQLHQSTAGKHSFPQMQRNAQFVPLHDTDDATGCFVSFAIAFPNKTVPQYRRSPLFVGVQCVYPELRRAGPLLGKASPLLSSHRSPPCANCHPERSDPILSSAPNCGASGRVVEGSLRRFSFASPTVFLVPRESPRPSAPNLPVLN